MDFRIEQLYINNFSDWDSEVIQLLKTPNSEITDPVKLMQKAEYIQKLKDNLREHAPNTLSIIRDKETLYAFLDRLLETIQNPESQSTGNPPFKTGITYHSLDTGEEIKSKEEIPIDYLGRVEEFLAKIPILGLETTVDSDWFPTTERELGEELRLRRRDGHNLRKRKEQKRREIMADPGTTDLEINFFSYFDIIPGKEVIRRVEDKKNGIIGVDSYKYLPESYPYAQISPNLDSNITESNYLQYTAPISVSDNLGTLLNTFNRKWGLLEPKYIQMGQEDADADLRGRGYYGGLEVGYSGSQYRAVIGDDDIPDNFMLRWNYDLLARLSFAKKNGSLDLTTDVVGDLMELVYRPQSWGTYKNRSVSANTTSKAALAILGGFPYSSIANRRYKYERSKGRVFSFFEKAVARSKLTPSDFRKFYFHPEYSTKVFLLRNQEKIDRYHQEVAPLLEQILATEEELELEGLLPALEFIRSYRYRHRKAIFEDTLLKIGENINPEDIDALLNGFPEMIAYLPDDFLENLEPDLVQKVVIKIAKDPDYEYFADFLRQQLDALNSKELNLVITQANKAINYTSQEKLALLELSVLLNILKKHLPNDLYNLECIKSGQSCPWFGTIKLETFRAILGNFETPEDFFRLLIEVPRAILTLDDTIGNILSRLQLPKRLQLLGNLSMDANIYNISQSPIVHKIRDTITENSDLVRLSEDFPKTLYFLSPDQLGRIGGFKLDYKDIEWIESNLVRISPQLADFSLTPYSPQTPEFKEIARESKHAINLETTDSMVKARGILDRTDLGLKEQAMAYYTQVPTIYRKRLEESGKDGFYEHTLVFDKEKQLAELDLLSSEMSDDYSTGDSEMSDDYSTEDSESGARFRIEGDLEKRKEIIDFFNSGVSGSNNFIVDQIYRIEVPKLTEKWTGRTNPSNNLKLLWHGTGKGNLMSIMQNGLKMPQISGMFGRGIYFAPLSVKSMGYSGRIRYSCDQRIGNNDEGWLLYNIVDMGKVYYPTRTGEPSITDFDSLHAPGGTHGLKMDEVVIYDPSRVLTTHLVKIRCK